MRHKGETFTGPCHKLRGKGCHLKPYLNHEKYCCCLGYLSPLVLIFVFIFICIFICLFLYLFFLGPGVCPENKNCILEFG